MTTKRKAEGIVFRYANGDERRWTSDTYKDAGCLGTPIYVDPKECPFQSPPTIEAGTDATNVTSLKKRKEAQRQQEFSDDIRAQQRARMESLFHYLSVDMEAPDAWRQLAWALIESHVPGFQISSDRPLAKPKRGRTKEWSLGKQIELVERFVEAGNELVIEASSRASTGLTTVATIRRVKKKYARDYSGVSEASLKRRYAEASKALSAAIAKPRRISALTRLMGYQPGDK